MEAPNAIQPPVGTHPNLARGEVLLPVVEGQPPFPVRFSLRVLHDYTQTTGHKLLDMGELLMTDLLGVVGQLVASAVRCYVPGAVVPANFQVGDALDLIEQLTPAENAHLITVIMAALRIDENPLFQALIAKSQQLPAPAETSGANTSPSPLVS